MASPGLWCPGITASRSYHCSIARSSLESQFPLAKEPALSPPIADCVPDGSGRVCSRCGWTWCGPGMFPRRNCRAPAEVRLTSPTRRSLFASTRGCPPAVRAPSSARTTRKQPPTAPSCGAMPSMSARASPATALPAGPADSRSASFATWPAASPGGSAQLANHKWPKLAHISTSAAYESAFPMELAGAFRTSLCPRIVKPALLSRSSQLALVPIPTGSASRPCFSSWRVSLANLS